LKRIVIVGGGPAGVRAAEVLVGAGQSPVLIDEGRNSGGQIYRRQPENFTRSPEQLYGSEATRARAVHDAFDRVRAHIDYRPETLAWNIADGRLHLLCNGRSSQLDYDALIICSGATDRLMPAKGWHYAGTFTLGGAQVALKSQACAIGRKIVFMGTGPLLYLVAAQYVQAGAGVVAVLDTSPASLRWRALPLLLAQPATALKGLALLRVLRRAGVPVHQGITPVEVIGGNDAGVRGVVVQSARGQRVSFDCDALALGYHLRPETQLAELAQCDIHFDAASRLWLPRCDADGRSSVRGIYLAGDGAEVLGAVAAECSGQLAALALLHDTGDAGDAVREAEMARLRTRVAGLRRFAAGLRTAFPWPQALARTLSDDTILCRCEGITVGAVRGEVREHEASEINRAKAFSRVGMGRCQGRYCAYAAAEVIAAAAGIPVEQVGRLRGQAPVKPLPVGVDAGTS
jgi:NADPH-dependent 2,4-dienoyl-CoA reductase/sulfur reductase-like enzyme